MNKEWWAGLSWQAKFFVILFSFSAASALVIKLGLITVEPSYELKKPPFNDQECRWRLEREMFGGLDVSQLSDDAISTIAAICAKERVEYQGY